VKPKPPDADDTETLDLTPTAENLLRMAWKLGGNSGEPHGPERKRLVRRIRMMFTRGTKPTNGAALTKVAYNQAMRFFHVLEYNADRDLSDLKDVPALVQRTVKGKKVLINRQYELMAKPWKGNAGRAASSKRKLAMKKQAIRLRDQGLTQLEIAKKMGLVLTGASKRKIESATRRVRRWLNDK